MPQYTHTTLANFKSQLSEMLGDRSKTFFTDVELTSYTQEALLTWGAASLYYRTTNSFLTDNSIAFYDLAAELPDLLILTKDRDIAQQLMFSLLEPQITDWLLWQGSEQFSLQAISSAIQHAADRFLLESGIFMSVFPVTNLLTPVSKVTIPEDVLDVRRVASYNFEEKVRILSQEDPASLQAYMVDWESPKSKPEFWSVITEPLRTLQLAPPANDITLLQLLVIPNANTVDFEVGQILGIPSCFTWAIKYLALAELLGPHTQAADLIRAKYAAMRGEEAIALAQLYPSALNAHINGKQINISSLSDFDTYQWNWQNQSGVPEQMAVASWNLIALSPVPSSSDVSIEIDYVSNPPLPSADTDFIQIDKGYIGMLLDFCRHLALFKVGGEEFLESKQGYDRMIQAASLHNDRLIAQSRLFSSLAGKVETEKQHRKFSATTADDNEQAA